MEYVNAKQSCSSIITAYLGQIQYSHWILTLLWGSNWFCIANKGGKESYISTTAVLDGGVNVRVCEVVSVEVDQIFILNLLCICHPVKKLWLMKLSALWTNFHPSHRHLNKWIRQSEHHRCRTLIGLVARKFCLLLSLWETRGAKILNMARETRLWLVHLY